VTTYRYLLADLRTNAILAELPFTNVQFSKSLNSIGTMSGSLLITDLTEAAMNINAATIPGRNAIYIDRNGEIIWGGVIWSRTYEGSSQHIQISAREFLSYFERRRITTDSVYTAAEMFTIIQDLFTNAQGADGDPGNIGLNVDLGTSGVAITKNYYAYELKTVYSALQDLSRAAYNTGFDYRVDLAYDGGGGITKTLNVGFPRLGRVYSDSDVNVPVFEYPAGNVVTYEYPENASAAANKVWVSGGGSNEGKLIASATNTDYLTAGWPLLEENANYSDIFDSTVLSDLAQGQLDAIVYPPVTLKIVAPAYTDPQLGSFEVGDDVRIRIRDPYFANGLDSTYRLVSQNVQVGENNQGELMTLTLSLPTGN
jgi:hypothetical protein